MSEKNYDEVYDEMENGTSNMLILGRAGSGKSHLIRKLCENRKDIIIICPTGIASMNIGGRTIDSVFGFKPYGDIYTMPPENEMFMMQCANILLIDEISMVRFNVIDRMNETLKIIRRNDAPFGGLRLLLSGDLHQLEPIVNAHEKEIIIREYFEYTGDAGFYNARVMQKDDFLMKSFKKYFLTHNFRQKNDLVYQNILNEIREGNVSDNTMEILNQRFYNSDDFNQIYNEGYHFLTLTKRTRDIINKSIIEKLPGYLYTVEPIRLKQKEGYKIIERSQIENTIEMKIGMNVMFIVNDHGVHRRWANGTMGKIEDINASNGIVHSVKIKVKKDDNEIIYDVGKIRVDIYGLIDDEPEVVYNVINFPFLPCIATTIHKMQGMTLEKAAIVLDKKVTMPNLIYVALSRIIELKNLLILERKLCSNDIIISSKIDGFLNSIKDQIVNVVYNTEKIIRKRLKIKERRDKNSANVEQLISA